MKKRTCKNIDILKYINYIENKNYDEMNICFKNFITERNFNMLKDLYSRKLTNYDIYLKYNFYGKNIDRTVQKHNDYILDQIKKVIKYNYCNSIYNCILDLKICNILYNFGIFTIIDLSKNTKEDLVKIKGISIKIANKLQC